MKHLSCKRAVLYENNIKSCYTLKVFAKNTINMQRNDY